MIIITKHAFRRAKERNGLGKSAFRRFVMRAVERNIRYKDTVGRMRRWLLSRIDPDHRKYKANPIIYGDLCLMVVGDTIVTVIKIPANLLPIDRFVKKQETEQ